MSVFNKQKWYDISDTANHRIPISATNLNRIEDGIESALKRDIGFISFYCKSAPPSGWLVCDGTAVSRETYKSLFDCIGTTFGEGDGSTTFNLPDLRGEFIRGWNSGTVGTDANREFASKQAATRFSTNSIGGVAYEDNGETSTRSTTSPNSSSSASGAPTISIRPNNIALLPCIFTGVFD